MAIEQRLSSLYPVMWLRWVRQQVTIAVRYELTAANPLRGPHLRGLPLTCGPEKLLDIDLIRNLIHADPGDRHSPQCCERIVDALLDDPRIAIAEPDLATMLSWHLTQYAARTPPHPGMQQAEDDPEQDHECFDPEQVAAELVKSGLVAGTWTLAQAQQQSDRLRLAPAGTRARPSATRHVNQGVAATQLLFPLFA